MRHAAVRRERALGHERLQNAGRHLAHLVRHHRIAVAVALEHRRRHRRQARSRKRLVQRQPAREAHNAAQPLRLRQAGVQGQRAALREAAEHDALVRDARLHLAVDQAVDQLRGGGDARLILRPGDVERAQVEPGVHAEAAVQADRHHFGGRTDDLHVGGTTVGERVQPAVAVLVAWGRGINYILTLIYIWATYGILHHLNHPHIRLGS